jgi:hypothetical protein
MTKLAPLPPAEAIPPYGSMTDRDLDKHVQIDIQPLIQFGRLRIAIALAGVASPLGLNVTEVAVTGHGLCLVACSSSNLSGTYPSPPAGLAKLLSTGALSLGELNARGRLSLRFDDKVKNTMNAFIQLHQADGVPGAEHLLVSAFIMSRGLRVV